MQTRHTLALLLGVAPIVAAGQLATAQPTTNAAMNHQNMDHSTMNHAATPAGNVSNGAAEASNAVDATPTPTAEPGNSGDDAPPQ